jgi:prephenate dehydratase
MRIAYLGPAGTFTEDALRETGVAGNSEPLRTATVREAILAVERGEADRALVPFENSIEGSVRATLDALAFDAERVTIVGEHDYAVRPCLIARDELPLERITAVLSHPQPLAQCARFIREELPALGAHSAAELYDCTVIREGVEDESENVTRFVWIAPVGTEPDGGGTWKTSLVFSELGEDHPGALVEALLEFSDREVNLTRIESRPLRRGLGRYMFFIDLEGAAEELAVAEAIEGLRGKAESVRVLGSYPVA